MNAIPRDRDPDLQAAIPIYLRRLHAQSTKDSYVRELKRFLAWLADNAPVDAEVLPRYVEALRARSLSATTVAWRASVIASFLKDAHRQGIIDRDVTEGYRLPRGTRGFAPRVLSSGELKLLLRTPDRRSWHGRRDLAALTLMALAGLRVGEVALLRVCDITLHADRVGIKVRGKGGRVRRVALAGKNASPIRAWATMRGSGHSAAPFFIARRTEDDPSRVMTVAGLDYVVRKHGRAAGLAGVHAHALRHTAASLMLAHGANLVAVRDALGHASVVTTSRYLHATGKAPSGDLARYIDGRTGGATSSGWIAFADGATPPKYSNRLAREPTRSSA